MVFIVFGNIKESLTRQSETEQLVVNNTSIVSAREEREDVIIDICGEVKAISVISVSSFL